MEKILEKAKKYKYNSFNYVDLEDILAIDKENIIINEEFIFMYSNNDEGVRGYWAADTEEDFIVGINKAMDIIYSKSIEKPRIYLEFIPENFVLPMERLGFKVNSEFFDYWIDDLNNIKNIGSKNYIIRRIKKEEYERVSDITKACLGYSRGFRGEDHYFVKEWNENEESIILVAELNNEVVGACFLNIYGHESSKGAVLWIRELAVEPKYHSKGIGKELIYSGLKWGIENGAMRSFLACDTKNYSGIKIYESFGYKRKEGESQINMDKG